MALGQQILSEYEKTRAIGAGGFATVHCYQHRVTGHLVAVKVAKDDGATLNVEYRVYTALQGLRAYPKGFCHMHGFGRIKDFRGLSLTLDLLGKSVQTVSNEMLPAKFNRNAVIDVGVQMLERLEVLHGCGFLHLDIKPANMVYGISSPGLIYLIDFGLSGRFFGTELSNCTMDLGDSDWRGCAMYASQNALLELRLGPCDDVESLVYSLIKLGTKSLPWAKKSSQEIQIRKDEMSPDDLCSGFPGIAKVLIEVRAASFDDRLCYNRLRRYLLEDQEPGEFPEEAA